MTANRVFTLDFGDRPRRYLVHEPAARHGFLPVVLFLHGAGGTAAWSLGETGWDATADQRGFLLVLPEAERPDPGQPPGFLKNPQVWNDGSPQQDANRPRVDDVGFVNAVLDDVARHYAVDPARTYATGFSNGAGMVFRLGAELSERFAALAPVAGHCWLVHPHPAVPRPTHYLVGTQDPLVPLAGGNIVSPWGTAISKPAVRTTLDRWAAALGCVSGAVTQSEHDGVRELRYRCEPVELVAYFIEGLGHHWPGGRGQLSRRLAGTPSQRIGANDRIADFFARHSR